MRIVDSALQAAIDNSDGIKIQPRLTIYRNHMTPAITVDETYASPLAEYPGIHTDNPLTQDCFIYDDYAFTLIATQDHKLQTLFEGSSVVINASFEGTDLECASWSRPSIAKDVIFFEDTAGVIYRATYDKDIWMARTETPITNVEIVDNSCTYKGSLYAIREDTVAHFYIDEGGVGITIFTYNYDESSFYLMTTWDGRFMFPGETWDETEVEIPPDYSKLRRLNFAGVAQLPESVFFYFSHPDGSVVGVRYRKDDYINANLGWSDIFTAIPADLTRFMISNVTYDWDDSRNVHRIFIAGQFDRTSNYSSGVTYNMLLWSDDGRTFSIDRFVLFSTLGYRFMAFKIYYGRLGSAILFRDANRTADSPATWATHQKLADSLIYPSVISMSGGQNQDWQIKLSNSDDSLTDKELVRVGSVVDLEIGVNTGTDFVYTHYETSIISKVQNDSANAIRNLILTLTPEGIWRTSNTSYPFYMEMQSKESIRDDASAMDNLYIAPNTNGVLDPFFVWLSDRYSSFGAKHHDNETTIWWSEDLVTQNYLSGYPTSLFPMTIKIYCWSRIGLPDANPNVTDDTPDTNTNDSFYPMFLIKDINGYERTVEITDTYAVDGITYPPQTWKPGNDRGNTGTYPIVFVIQENDGMLLLYDKIEKIGIKVVSNGPTVYSIERIEIP